MSKFQKTVVALILVLTAVVSYFFVAEWATATATHQATIDSVDEKITTVMELTAASTTASAVISALPDDTATPIADKLADFSSYFLLVLCALYLEKYLVTITGYAAFSVLIPLACAGGIVSLFRQPEVIRRLAVKLALFAVAIYLVIPTSIKVSDLIYDTYRDSIEETIDTAKNSSVTEGETDEEESGWLDKVLNTVTELTQTLTDSATDVLRNFIEALAVMIVTSCLIPLLVLFFFVWLVRILLGIDIQPRIPRLAAHRPGQEQHGE